MGHLPEMASPQHAKKLMSTPKPITEPVAERIQASEPAELKAIPPRGKLSDKEKEPAQVPYIPQHASAAANTIDVVVRGADRPLHHYYEPKGNPSKEEADMALMAYCGEEVETKYAVNQYWRDKY